MAARFSRSAVICCSIACCTPGEGWMSRSSTRVTFTPQGSVAWSSSLSSTSFTSLRVVKVWSRSSLPISARIWVSTRFTIAACRLSTA